MIINIDDMEDAGPIYLRYGGADKPTIEMNQEELAQLAAAILRKAREKAFSRGLPVYFSKDGMLMAEWPDGRIEEVNTHD